MIRYRSAATLAVVALWSTIDVGAWGAQGHRLVGLIAAERLTPAARQQVNWLLDGQTLADVSSWADTITGEQVQSSYWHYLNIPPDARGYDRDRDCPRQPGVEAGSRSDRWRDCVVDRITYWEQRLADPKLDRADRATALKFVVHFIGDLHQPFHALGVGRGGNDVRVSVFGQSDCSNDPARPSPCNLHSVWDGRLISRRNLDDGRYLGELNKLIAQKGWSASQSPGTPAQWAEQSFRLAKEALVDNGANIDEGYFRRHIGVIEERMALAGLRLAAVLNRVLATPPPM
ncbi:MAG TPA: S1/P1 nuclease [Vicinamibacterales bacterium]|nr:S1/P1 nuclease [Vicinamibacterales bacterium]